MSCAEVFPLITFLVKPAIVLFVLCVLCKKIFTHGLGWQKLPVILLHFKHCICQCCCTADTVNEPCTQIQPSSQKVIQMPHPKYILSTLCETVFFSTIVCSILVCRTLNNLSSLNYLVLNLPRQVKTWCQTAN